jgi:hypothetical protein
MAIERAVQVAKERSFAHSRGAGHEPIEGPLLDGRGESILCRNIILVWKRALGALRGRGALR